MGLPTLRALAARPDFEVVLVLTRPDRPAGRGLKLRPTPVKELAQELGLPLFQPEKVNREVERLRELRPDVTVVVAYGQILSKDVIEVPRLGTVNLHASLLPKYRGAAPVQWALIKGETVTGVTTFLIDEGLDTGPILLQREVPIAPEDTAGSLERKLAEVGAELMVETLEGLREGTLDPQPQDDAQATYAPKITQEMARLDWTKSAQELHHWVRALEPVPGAFTLFRGRRLKVHRTRVLPEAPAKGEPGAIVGVGEEGLRVAASDGVLELVEVHPEGKRRMSGRDFANGYRVRVGERLE